MRHAQIPHEILVGHCCGCRQPRDLLLYKSPGIFRYRCADCFFIENGRRHPRHAGSASAAEMVISHLWELVHAGVVSRTIADAVRVKLTFDVIARGAEAGLTSRDIVEQFLDPALLRLPG